MGIGGGTGRAKLLVSNIRTCIGVTYKQQALGALSGQRLVLAEEQVVLDNVSIMPVAASQHP